MNAIFLLKPKSAVDYLYDDDSFRHGLDVLRTTGFTAIPVITREGFYAGSIRAADLLWYLADHRTDAPETLFSVPIRALLRNGWNPAVGVSVTMDELLARAMDQNFVPVTDDRDTFIGIITRREILGYFMHRQGPEPDREKQ